MKKYDISNYHERKPNGYSFGVSLTIPDQTLSIREILLRYARGQSISGNNLEPVYLGDNPEIPLDFPNWDIEDKQEFIKFHGERVRKMQTEIQHNQELLREEENKKLSKLDSLSKDLEQIKKDLLKPDNNQVE